LTPRERRDLELWNQTATDYPRDEVLPSLFEAVAARNPDRIAIAFGSERVTYSELNRLANRLSRRLRARGVAAEATVGLCVERSIEMVVALLAILKAGGAYLPVDPGDPPARLREIAANARPRLWLASRRFEAVASGLGETLPVESALAAADSESDQNPDPGTRATSLAYVLHTSGSTGAPKGVCVPHRAVIRLVRNAGYARLDEDQTILQWAPLSFDASTFEIWGALANGGCLVLAPPGPPALDLLEETIRRYGVTTAWLTAGLFHLVVDHRIGALKPVKQLLAGGDTLSLTRVRRVVSELPECQLINGYGPTESTTFATCYPIRQLPPDAPSVPIGRPIGNTRIYVVDEKLRAAPPGEPGEICIAGDGLALGYLNRPDLTAERFVRDPFSGDSEARLYRTGDRGRWHPHGNLEFLGRLDRQVKISGHRVEPEEIEAALERHASVSRAVVSRWVRDPAREKSLVAHVVLQPNAAWDEPALRRHLSALLPAYMLPSALSRVESLPLTPAGKIDRDRLAPPPPPASSATGGSNLEQALLAIWRETLGTDAIGPDDNFFDAGGTSLGLLEIHARAEALVGRRLPWTTMFDRPTVRALAAHLSGEPGRTGSLADLRDRILRERGRGRTDVAH
jgi:amino acid adenylation domain-containing protein